MSASHTVVLSAEAGSNIKEAWHWIAESDPEAADRWYDGLIAALETLAKLPQRCPISPETRLGLIDTEIHQLLYGQGYWKYRSSSPMSATERGSISAKNPSNTVGHLPVECDSSVSLESIKFTSASIQTMDAAGLGAGQAPGCYSP